MEFRRGELAGFNPETFSETFRHYPSNIDRGLYLRYYAPHSPFFAYFQTVCTLMVSMLDNEIVSERYASELYAAELVFVVYKAGKFD